MYKRPQNLIVIQQTQSQSNQLPSGFWLAFLCSTFYLFFATMTIPSVEEPMPESMKSQAFDLPKFLKKHLYFTRKRVGSLIEFNQVFNLAYLQIRYTKDELSTLCLT